MYRRVVRLLSALAFAAVVGCSETENVYPSGDVMRFDACIADNYDTRTGMGGAEGTTASFTASDNIGIYETLTGRSNVSYTYNGTSWSTAAPMYWRDGVSTHTFYAYYPYKATVSGTKVALPVLSTQTMTSSPSPQNDMLVFGPLNQVRSAGVNLLLFKHAFALVQFNVRKNALALLLLTLKGITISGGNTAGGSNRFGIFNITNNPAQVGYDLVAGAITAAANDATSYVNSVAFTVPDTTLSSSAYTTFYAFVLPGTYNTTPPSVSLSVSVAGALPKPTGTSILKDSSNNNIVTLQAGTKYVFNVTIGLLTRSSSDISLNIEAEDPVPF